MAGIFSILRNNWQVAFCLACIGLALLLSSCVTSGAAVSIGPAAFSAGQVVPADLSPAQRLKLVTDCSRYDYYWSGDLIPANSFSRRTIREIRAVLIVPKSARVRIVGGDWRRLVGCPWVRRGRVPEMVAPTRGRDAGGPRLMAVLGERGQIVGWLAASATGGMSVLARGRTAGGLRSYEVSAMDRFDPNGPGGGSGAGGAGGGGGGGGGGR